MNNKKILKSKLPLLFVPVLIAACGSIKPTAVLWKSYIAEDAAATQYLRAAVLDPAGNTYNTFSLNGEEFLRKLSQTGEELWRMNLPESADHLDATEHGVVVTHKYKGARTILISPDGVELWSKTFEGAGMFVRNVNLTASGNVYLNYSTDDHSVGNLLSLAADGSEKWRYTYALRDTAVAPDDSDELSNGNVIMLASSETSIFVRIIDADGQELATHGLPELNVYSTPKLMVKDDQAYITWRKNQTDNLSALNPDGSIRWSHSASYYGSVLNCSEPTADRIACVENFGSSISHLTFISLDGEQLSSTRLNFVPVHINGSDTILSNGDGKWVTREYVGPTSAANLVDAQLPKPFHYRYHIFDVNGTETSSVVMSPGAVTFKINWDGNFTVPNITKGADVTPIGIVTSDRLILAGWFGKEQLASNNYVTAYELKDAPMRFSQ